MSRSLICNKCGRTFEISISLASMSCDFSECPDCNPRNSVVKCKCEQCNKIFYDTRSRVNHNRGIYCAKTCRITTTKYKFQGIGNPNPMKRDEHICKVCGKKVINTPSRFRKSSNTYCDKECYRKARSLFMSGKNAPNYNNGKSYEPYCEKFTEEFKERVRAVFNCDCILCGCHQKDNIVNGKSEKLSVHHVGYNKMSCCDASEPLFAALCRKCHAKTNKKSKEARDKIMNKIMNILLTQYGGKTFFTKDEFYKTT